jgi:phage-related protein
LNKQFVRRIYYYRNYYPEFFRTLNPEVKKKFNWTLELISVVEHVPDKYFRHLTGTIGLFEIRVEVGTDIYRVFSFFDKGKLVVLVNGFQKKSRKTPEKEIEFSEKLKKQYFNEKEK